VELYEFVKMVYKDKPEWAETLKTNTIEFDQMKEKLHKKVNFLEKHRPLIVEYLKAMKVDVQENYQIEELTADLYIPGKK